MTILPVNTQSTDKAVRFVNASDETVSRLARRKFNAEHREDNKRFVKNIYRAAASIPFVAVASGLLSKQGVKSSVKAGTAWGLAIAAPSVVHGINKAYQNRHPEKESAGLSPTGELAASIGGFLGANYLLNKASKNTKVNSIADTIIAGAKETFGKIKEQIKLPENLSEDLAKYAEKAKNKLPESLSEKLTQFTDNAKNKVPENAEAKFQETAQKVANDIKKLKEPNFTKAALKTGKNVVKTTVKYAPELILLGSFGAFVGKAISNARGLSKEKAEIKNAQLDTARNVIDNLQSENSDLKDKLAVSEEE